MLDTDLYEGVLMRCVRMGADEVRVVSGYASPELCSKLVLDSSDIDRHLAIDLIVGMVGEEGIDASSHQAFSELQGPRIGRGGSLHVRYSQNGTGVHSKVVVWFRGGRAVEAWAGSANFTQRGFGLLGDPSSRLEVMTQIAPVEGLRYFERIAQISVPIDQEDVRLTSRAPRRRSSVDVSHSIDGADLMQSGVETVVLPLVALRSNYRTSTTRGSVPERSGLNWGQRDARERDQAYISIPATIQQSGFFPPRGIVFRVVTDDGTVLLMVRAQDNGKALHTTQNNSLLGRYFRRKLGVPLGEPVSDADLVRYGSRFVRFSKRSTLDGELVYGMLFDSSLEAEGRNTYSL